MFVSKSPEGDVSFSIYETYESINNILVYFEVQNVDKQITLLKAFGFDFINAPEDKVWLWREARMNDQGNLIIIYHAGEARLKPLWKVGT